MGWIDTHCHIFCKKMRKKVSFYIKNAKKKNIEKILVICNSLKELFFGFKIIKKYNFIDLAIGIHPNFSEKINNTEIKKIFSFLPHKKIIAIGEIGLDYSNNYFNKNIQKKYFKKQIIIANKYKMPVIIHSRNSFFDLLKILKNFPVIKKGIIHCFSGDLKTARKLINIGFYIGINGILTFKNNKNIKKIVKNILIKNIFLETDSPFLSPVPKRGKINQPAYIKIIADYILKIKKLKKKKCMNIMKKNYINLFYR